MARFGISQPVRRVEDERLLRGQGSYIDDIDLPGQARAYFLRSPHAHANVVRIDVARAAAAPISAPSRTAGRAPPRRPRSRGRCAAP